MKRSSNPQLSILAGAMALGLFSMGSASAAELLTANRPVSGEYIVVLKKEKASLAGEVSVAGAKGHRPKVAVMAQQIASSHSAKLVRSYKSALRGFVVKADDRTLARLLADDRVEYVQENGVVELYATQNDATWGLDRIDQRDLPLSDSYTYDTTGTGVHAYIIDSGIKSDHTEFTGRLGAGYDAIEDGTGTEDCADHGTHVAGTVGGTTWGVAKGVTLHAVRVFGCGRTTDTAYILAGIDWVAENRIRPAVANMSLGGPTDRATDEAVQGMIDAGVVAVVAAGNSNQDACNYSPARVADAITVGATMSTDRRPDSTNWGFARGSNYGACVDIFAPGHQIVSSTIAGTATSAAYNGTSMAAPHVAGAAALYLAVNPLATPAQVTQAILDNATTGAVTNEGVSSPNRLLYSVFAAANPPEPPANKAPVANFTSSASGLTVKFTDTSTDSDGSIASRSWDFGDGTSSTLANPGHTYAAAGTYSVKLTVTDNNGATNTKTGSVTVTAPPPSTVQTYTNGTDVTLSWIGPVASSITVSGRPGNAPSNAVVSFGLVHANSLVGIELIAPSGKVYTVKGIFDNYGTVNLRKSVNVDLSDEVLNGTWKLRVRDYWFGAAKLDTWSIKF